MFALSSFNPEVEAGLRSSLNSEFGSNAQFEGMLVDLVLSGEGSFVRFQWADWPADLHVALAARVSKFHEAYSYLQPVRAGSPEWNAIFGGSVADDEAADKIAEILGKHLGSQVAWVRSERDRKGKIETWVGLKGGGSIDFWLSWKDYSVGGIGGVDLQALRAAMNEVHEWASSRIQPILDTLKAKLQELYGDRFRGLYVFGSYAQPDAGVELPADSDLDVALLLSDLADAGEEIDRFGHITAGLSLENDLVISLIPVRETDFREGRTNFARVISEYAVLVE